MLKSPSMPQAPLFLGDNLALDFINTEYGVGAACRDCLTDDASVLAWLKLAKAVPESFQAEPKGLLLRALELRASAKSLVAAAKSQREASVDIVNRVLESERSFTALRWDESRQAFTAGAQQRYDDAVSLLAPVAKALAQLLAETDLDLVRQCEAHDCTLLFHDLTKSHRRRWCSMALCGNRAKVAAFRSRQKMDEVP
jgi:predicted RNA-binding Zn ribbon-like protein